MKIYTIVWSERTGVDSSEKHFDDKAFTSKAGAISHIEKKGLKECQFLGYSTADTILSARIVEMDLYNAIETKDGVFISLEKE